MQIRNLSQQELGRWGEILPACPPEDGIRVKTRLEFAAGAEIVRYEITKPAVLDYVSGMSLLVIYQEGGTDIFYLDRVVALQPGTRLSLLPMDGDCCVDLLAEENALLYLETIPVSSLENQGKSLQFEKIYTFLYQECAHNFYFRGEKHKPYELVYVDRGALHNLVRGQDILLEQQDFMIIDSNDWHTQYSDLPVSFLTVSFWAAESGLSAVVNKRISMNAQARGIFKKMLSQNRLDAYSGEYMESLLKILLIELLHAAGADVPALHPASHWENSIVDKAIQLISENPQKQLSLEELAGAVHVSVPYLYKLFQLHLGTSPGKYITKIRIEECKVLLRDGRLTMGQIAERMGYSSQQQFSRQFANICGISPTQYLRSLR